MSDRNKNWFTKATLNAQMSEAPAIMQASGWTSDPKKGVEIGDPNAEGARLLSEALKQIGLSSVTSLTSEVMAALAAKYLPAAINTTKAKIAANPYSRLIKSRKIFNPIQKAADNAPTYKDAQKILHPNIKPGDNTYFELYDNDFEPILKNQRYGHITAVKRPSGLQLNKSGSIAEAQNIHTDILKEAEDFANTRKTLQQLADEMHKIENEVKVSGRTTRLAQDFDLSTDSVPLGYGRYAKYVSKGEGKVSPVMDNGTIRYIRMNDLGFKNAFSASKDAVKKLNQVTGLDLPMPVKFLKWKYVPAVEYLHFNNGGLLKQYPKY